MEACSNSSGAKVWEHVFAVVPIGKPRMTQRDRWKQRKAVVDYRFWCDTIRLACLEHPIPDASRIQELSWKAVFPMPRSWSQRKRRRMNGELHRQRPDRDNIDKAILDCLFDEDSGIAMGHLEKTWGEFGSLRIRIRYV